MQRSAFHDAKLGVQLGMLLARYAGKLQVGLHGRVVEPGAAHEADTPLRVEVVPDAQRVLMLGQEVEDIRGRRRCGRRIAAVVVDFIGSRAHQAEGREGFVCGVASGCRIVVVIVGVEIGSGFEVPARREARELP